MLASPSTMQTEIAVAPSTLEGCDSSQHDDPPSSKDVHFGAAGYSELKDFSMATSGQESSRLQHQLLFKNERIEVLERTKELKDQQISQMLDAMNKAGAKHKDDVYWLKLELDRTCKEKEACESRMAEMHRELQCMVHVSDPPEKHASSDAPPTSTNVMNAEKYSKALEILDKQMIMVKSSCGEVISSLKEEITDVVAEKSRVEMEILSQMAILDQEKKALEVEYQAKLKVRDEKIHELQHSHDALSAKNGTASETDKKIVELMKEVSLLREEKGDLQRRLSTERVKFEAEVETLNSERDEVVERLTTEREALEKECICLKEEKRLLIDNVATGRAEILKLSEENAKLSDQVDVLESGSPDSFMSESDEALVAKLERKCVDLAREVDGLKTEKKHLQEKLASDHVKAEQKAQLLEELNDGMRKEVAVLQSMQQTLQSRLDADFKNHHDEVTILKEEKRELVKLVGSLHLSKGDSSDTSSDNSNVDTAGTGAENGVDLESKGKDAVSILRTEIQALLLEVERLQKDNKRLQARHAVGKQQVPTDPADGCDTELKGSDIESRLQQRIADLEDENKRLIVQNAEVLQQIEGLRSLENAIAPEKEEAATSLERVAFIWERTDESVKSLEHLVDVLRKDNPEDSPVHERILSTLENAILIHGQMKVSLMFVELKLQNQLDSIRFKDTKTNPPGLGTAETIVDKVESSRKEALEALANIEETIGKSIADLRDRVRKEAQESETILTAKIQELKTMEARQHEMEAELNSYKGERGAPGKKNRSIPVSPRLLQLFEDEVDRISKHMRMKNDVIAELLKKVDELKKREGAWRKELKRIIRNGGDAIPQDYLNSQILGCSSESSNKSGRRWSAGSAMPALDSGAATLEGTKTNPNRVDSLLKGISAVAGDSHLLYGEGLDSAIPETPHRRNKISRRWSVDGAVPSAELSGNAMEYKGSSSNPASRRNSVNSLRKGISAAAEDPTEALKQALRYGRVETTKHSNTNKLRRGSANKIGRRWSDSGGNPDFISSENNDDNQEASTSDAADDHGRHGKRNFNRRWSTSGAIPHDGVAREDKLGHPGSRGDTFGAHRTEPTEKRRSSGGGETCERSDIIGDPTYTPEATETSRLVCGLDTDLSAQSESPTTPSDSDSCYDENQPDEFQSERSM